MDRLNEVVHFGARHMLHRDGLWMQPEPLLVTATVMDLLGSPVRASRQYGAGNPLMLSDPLGLFATPTANDDGTLEGLEPVMAAIAETQQEFRDPSNEHGHLWVTSGDGTETVAIGAKQGDGGEVTFSPDEKKDFAGKSGLAGATAGTTSSHHTHRPPGPLVSNGQDLSVAVKEVNKSVPQLMTTTEVGDTMVALIAPADPALNARERGVAARIAARQGSHLSSAQVQQFLVIVAPGTVVVTVDDSGHQAPASGATFSSRQIERWRDRIYE